MPLKTIRSQKGLIWWGNSNMLYKGLPPTFADSLPDKWGFILFYKWVEQNNIKSKDITPLDHLAFIGRRAMGTLEYETALPISGVEPTDINVQELFNYYQKILNEKETKGKNDGITKDELIEIGKKQDITNCSHLYEEVESS